ncbi:type III-B CRISPR module-associated protein Cmr5 [Suttonella ornithocola]|uniref:CRISPR type III-B/RAMP module-associated protein Cmr5 n=1 Tax=Suttonella ornithocola TaxID=279832 RepID=A0A380MR42_9GAMM|nr:type III-B CRISPR module-associated protein Cmr5 [Suttonella ornithocola]SUO95045.1 CRISPR type III-B/RAMP module-associated protein Cmr5 [Suttonella ornithocola]
MLTIRTQQYATRAYDLVKQQKDKSIEAEYRTLALNLPPMIMQSGLIQTLGFLQAKGKEQHRLLLEHLILTMKQHDDVDGFYQAVLASDIASYQLLTRQAIEAASWLKRYTQAFLADKTE